MGSETDSSIITSKIAPPPPAKMEAISQTTFSKAFDEWWAFYS